MCHMTYLADFFNRYRQGDVVAQAMGKAVQAVDPGLQVVFVFSPEDAKKLEDPATAGDAVPQGIQIRPSARSTGINHPGTAAAVLRALANELDAALMKSVEQAAAQAEKDAEAAKTPEGSPVPLPAAAG